MLVQEYLKKWRIFKRVKPKNDMMTELYGDFPLYEQIVNGMYHCTSLEVLWLVHVADWEGPLRK